VRESQGEKQEKSEGTRSIISLQRESSIYCVRIGIKRSFSGGRELLNLELLPCGIVAFRIPQGEPVPRNEGGLNSPSEPDQIAE
jgi:hypothetical protein